MSLRIQKPTSGRLTLKSYNTPAAIAGVTPTLDYRFALDRRELDAVSLTDKITYTGGTNGTFVGPTGVVERATTNIPRFDHDPVSRVSRGLLVEPERTNSIRNNTMVGAVAGTPGTQPTNWVTNSSTNLTRQVVGTGIENGIQYIDLRYNGTVTATRIQYIFFEGNSQISASAGQSWAASVWLKLVGGSLANISGIALQADVRDASSAYVSTPLQSQLSVAGDFTRFSASGSVVGATAAWIQPFLYVTTASSGTVDFTLRIGLPQLEQGAFATSVIPTTTTALTRPADSATISGAGVLTGTYTVVEKPAGCVVESGGNLVLQPGFTAERVMVFPAALSGAQITAIRGVM